MTKKEQRRFIRENMRTLTRNLLAVVPKMPRTWDGHQIRALIEDHARANNWGRCSTVRAIGPIEQKARRRARKEYTNDCAAMGIV